MGGEIMAFIPPDWFTGMLSYVFIYGLPILLGIFT